MTPSDQHNRLVPELITRLIKETDSETNAMVALESLVLGVMLYYRPNPRHAGEFMDSMTAAVIERMKP
jgi:hypothetical protein